MIVPHLATRDTIIAYGTHLTNTLLHLKWLHYHCISYSSYNKHPLLICAGEVKGYHFNVIFSCMRCCNVLDHVVMELEYIYCNNVRGRASECE